MFSTRSLIRGAVFAIATTAILQLPAAAQTSIDTPVGSPSREQCSTAVPQSVQPAAPAADVFVFPGAILRNGVRLGLGIPLGTWPAALFIQRALPAGSATRLLGVVRKSTG